MFKAGRTRRDTVDRDGAATKDFVTRNDGGPDAPVVEAVNTGSAKDLRKAFNEAFWQGAPVTATGDMLVRAFERGREDIARLLVTYGARPDDSQLEKILHHCDRQGRDRKHALRILATGGVYGRSEDYAPAQDESRDAIEDTPPRIENDRPVLTATQQAALDDLYAVLSDYNRVESAIARLEETKTPLSVIDPERVIDASPGFTKYPALSRPYVALLKKTYEAGADFSGLKPDDLIVKGDVGAVWALIEMGAAPVAAIDPKSIWLVMPDMSESLNKTDAHKNLLRALQAAGVPPRDLHMGATETAAAHGIEGVKFLIENDMARYRDFDPYAIWKKTPDMTKYPALSRDYADMMREMKKQGADFSRVAQDLRENFMDNPGALAFFMDIGVLSPRNVNPSDIVKGMAHQREYDRYSYSRSSARDPYIRLLDILKDNGTSMAAVNPAWYYAQTGDAERATALMDFNRSTARDVSPTEILRQVSDVERYPALSADHLEFVTRLAEAGVDFRRVDLRDVKLKNPGLAKFLVSRGYCSDKPVNPARHTPF